MPVHTCIGEWMYGRLRFNVCSSMPYIHPSDGASRQLRLHRTCMDLPMHKQQQWLMSQTSTGIVNSPIKPDRLPLRPTAVMSLRGGVPGQIESDHTAARVGCDCSRR